MGTRTLRGFAIGTIVLLVLAAAIWLIPGLDRETGDPSQDGGTDVAVLPSDAESGRPAKTEASSPPPADKDAPKPTDDLTDPEQVARAFMSTYPGDVQSLSDPTFLASLDGVDAPLLELVTDISLEQADHASGDLYERYAYTVSGTYQGEEVPIYTIVVARPVEHSEGRSAAENDLPFQVHSFDWSPAMLGDEDAPGPVAGKPAPISAQQRRELISQTRTGVIAEVLSVDPDETTEQRKARMDEVMVEPTDVTPPMSRSGRYAMTTEILSQAYSTEPGGPISITYTGTWVDLYDPTYNGSWSLTATITRDNEDTFMVHGVEETAPPGSTGNGEWSSVTR